SMFSFQPTAAKSPAASDPLRDRVRGAYRAIAAWAYRWSDYLSPEERLCCVELAQQRWPPTERQVEVLLSISAKVVSATKFSTADHPFTRPRPWLRVIGGRRSQKR